MQAPAATPLQGFASPQGYEQPTYEITEQDKARQKKIACAWKAYDGELDPPLQKTPEGLDPNVMTNQCGPVVDRGVEFLFGLELEIAVEEGAPAEAQQIVDKIWGRKEARLPLLQKLAMNGAMAGQAFLRIVPGDDGSYRLVAVDPCIVFVQTMPQDCETVLLYCIEYCVHQNVRGQANPQQIYYREEIKRIDPHDQWRGNDYDDEEEYEDVSPDGIDRDVTWLMQHWTRVGDRGPWTAAGEPIKWPYPFPPIFSCQNLPRPNNFWGKPDITPDVIGVNQALNLEQSCMNLDILLYGQPILYSTGTGEQIIDIKPGKIIGLPLTESKIVAVPIASDLANSLKFAADLRSSIDEQTGVPGVATGRIADMPRGNLSGIAIELLFMALLKKNGKKRCTYGELIIDVSKALFVLCGLSGEIDITLAWQDPLPHNNLESAQAAVMMQQLSISNTTLQRELGYDPEEELALKQTEDERKLASLNTPPLEMLQVKVPDTRPIFPQQQAPLQEQQGGQHAQ